MPIATATLSVFAAPTNTEIFNIQQEAERQSKIWRKDSALESRRLFLEAARYWLATDDSGKAAVCLREAAKLDLMLNQTKEAQKLLDQSLELERKNKNAEGESETLSYLAIVSIKAEKLDESQEFYQKALALAEKTGNPKLIARACFSAGEFFYRKRNLARMIEFQEKALRFFREAGDRIAEAETMTLLAYSYVMDSDRLKGRETAHQAVNIARGGGEARALAFALLALGDADQRMGNWQTAFTSFTEAETLFPDNLDLTEKAILFDRFGVFYETYGDLSLAQNYYQKSLELFRQSENVFGVSELLTVLGQIFRQLGETDRAIACFTEAYEIAKKSKDPVSSGMAEENLGAVYLNDRDFNKAFFFYQSALKNYKKVGMKHLIASVTEKLGELYEQQGKIEAARGKYLSALEMNRAISSTFAMAQTLHRLGQLANSENQTEKALSYISESVELTEKLHSDIANSKLKRSYLAEVYGRYELYINLLMKMQLLAPEKNYDIRALQVSERVRARSLLETLQLAQVDFSKGADAEIINRERETRALLNKKADELTDILSGNPEKQQIQKITDEINRLTNAHEEIKVILKQTSPVYSTIRNPPPFNVAEFQNRILDDKTILLEFSFGKDESYLWILDKTRLNTYRLPPRRQLELRIKNLRTLLAEREIRENETVENYQARITQAEKFYWSEARALSEEILGQAAAQLTDKRLIIAADGDLHYFPLGALPLPGTNNEEPILLTNEIVYEPSAQTLFLLAENYRTTFPAASKDLLVFSDPVFSADDARLPKDTRIADNSSLKTERAEILRFAESLKSLPRLAASKEEGNLIAEVIGRGKTDVLSGFSATRERALNSEVSDYKIIHFATHAMINEEHPELSGIVLSRFDSQRRKTDEFVRLQDVYGMNLSADLVVLSACNTGIGKRIKGEGLMSLNNAFLQVGAKSVVSSLWKVEDYATLETMKNFYQILIKEKATPSQALRLAQIKTRQNERFRSPFYWAAFTVQGNFKQSPDIQTYSDYSINWLMILIPVSGFGVYRFYKFLRT